METTSIDYNEHSLHPSIKKEFGEYNYRVESYSSQSVDYIVVPPPTEKDDLATAARKLREDYLTDSELTAFTALDSEEPL